MVIFNTKMRNPDQTGEKDNLDIKDEEVLLTKVYSYFSSLSLNQYHFRSKESS